MRGRQHETSRLCCPSPWSWPTSTVVNGSPTCHGRWTSTANRPEPQPAPETSPTTRRGETWRCSTATSRTLLDSSGSDASTILPQVSSQSCHRRPPPSSSAPRAANYPIHEHCSTANDAPAHTEEPMTMAPESRSQLTPLHQHRPENQMSSRSSARLTKAVLVNVVLLTMIAPLATDMYVPAFPVVGRDLGAHATAVQLTLTTYFVGMALGQLVGGPVSDQLGRRRPLLVSLGVMLLASLLCALSPTIGILMVARFIQGFSGGWAIVIAPSIFVGSLSRPGLAKSINLVQGVAGIAPIVGPLLGAMILELSQWRGGFLLFWGLGGGLRTPAAGRGPGEC